MADYFTYRNRYHEPTDWEGENIGWRYFGRASDGLQRVTGLDRDKNIALTGAGLGVLGALLAKSKPLSNPAVFATGAGAGMLGMMAANAIMKKYNNSVNQNVSRIINKERGNEPRSRGKYSPGSARR